MGMRILSVLKKLRHFISMAPGISKDLGLPLAVVIIAFGLPLTAIYGFQQAFPNADWLITY
jgi:hypothetical protein